MCFWFARRMHRKARVYGASSSGTARCFLVQRHCAREVLSVRNIPQFVTCISRRTECGHEPCAESVSIAPTEMHLSIRTAANPARVVRRLRLNAIPLPESWPREFRRAAASVERPFSRASFQDAHSVVAVPEAPPKHWWVTTPYPRLRCLVIPRQPWREHDHRRVAASHPGFAER